jgi:lysyl-tRNA synthetase class 2
MSPQLPPWAPGASLETLRLRARLLARTRTFFASRGLLEVDTPALMSCGVTDPQIHCLRAELPGLAGRQGYLQSSPEYAMKRLLAAGSGDIFQICHVFRGEEQGPLHNGEFTLIEWYRLGYSLEALMEEVDALVRELLGAAAGGASERVSYTQLLERTLGIDALQDSVASLRSAAEALGFDARLTQQLERDGLLDLLIGPAWACRHRATCIAIRPARRASRAWIRTMNGWRCALSSTAPGLSWPTASRNSLMPRSSASVLLRINSCAPRAVCQCQKLMSGCWLHLAQGYRRARASRWGSIAW